MANIDIFAVLLIIQKKHVAYFDDSKTTILDYITVDWVPPVSVRIIRHDMPAPLLEDITALLLPVNRED